MEMFGKVVVYDLPSENMVMFKENLEAQRKIKNMRIRCIRLLHSLGVQCTESVILVSPERYDMVDSVVNNVISVYESSGFQLPRPLIRVIDLHGFQLDAFRELAIRNIVRRLDYTIELVSDIITRLEELIREGRAGRVTTNLRRLKREWMTIRELAESLGITLPRDYSYLIELIDEALEELRRGQA
ncbi:MAG: hypothetical protein QXT26_07880 [Thermoproteota archaeon]